MRVYNKCLRRGAGTVTLPDFVWGVIGASVAWPVVEFVARPFQQFYDIRRQVNRCLVMYGNVGARSAINPQGEWKAIDLPKEEDDRLVEAQTALRGLAADMRAFANGEYLANLAVKRVGYDANKIASALISYSNNIAVSGGAKADASQLVERLLRIRSIE
jgi:hypothetical protein